MKGTARRVVIVRSPDPEIFEEAIFVVREEYLREAGSGTNELLREAGKAADGYLGRALGGPAKETGGKGWLCALTGAAGMGLLWLALEILKII